MHNAEAVRQSVERLLTKAEPEIQQLALDCLLPFRRKQLALYMPVLHEMIDEKTFREVGIPIYALPPPPVAAAAAGRQPHFRSCGGYGVALRLLLTAPTWLVICAVCAVCPGSASSRPSPASG